MTKPVHRLNGFSAQSEICVWAVINEIINRKRGYLVFAIITQLKNRIPKLSKSTNQQMSEPLGGERVRYALVNVDTSAIAHADKDFYWMSTETIMRFADHIRFQVARKIMALKTKINEQS